MKKTLCLVFALSTFATHSAWADPAVTAKLTCTANVGGKLKKVSFDHAHVLALLGQVDVDVARDLYALELIDGERLYLVNACEGGLVRLLTSARECVESDPSHSGTKVACTAAVSVWVDPSDEGYLVCNQTNTVDSIKGSCEGFALLAHGPCKIELKYNKPFVPTGNCPG